MLTQKKTSLPIPIPSSKPSPKLNIYNTSPTVSLGNVVPPNSPVDKMFNTLLDYNLYNIKKDQDMLLSYSPTISLENSPCDSPLDKEALSILMRCLSTK